MLIDRVATPLLVDGVVVGVLATTAKRRFVIGGGEPDYRGSPDPGLRLLGAVRNRVPPRRCTRTATTSLASCSQDRPCVTVCASMLRTSLILGST